jgi:putative flippase GtrA
VRLIRFIPERHRSLIKELLTFGMVGGINTALGQILFNVFLGLGALTANSISTAIATGCSFVLNRNITYRHRARTPLRRELPLFAALNLVGLGIQLAIISGGQRIFGVASTDVLEINCIRFGAVAVGTVFLLMTYRTFVFKKKPVEAEAAIVGVVPVEIVTDDVEFELLTDSLEAELEPEPADEPAALR